MPDLSLEQIAQLGRNGATVSEVRAALGRAMDASEREAYDRAKLAEKIRRKVEKARNSGQDRTDYMRRQMARRRADERVVDIPEPEDAGTPAVSTCGSSARPTSPTCSTWSPHRRTMTSRPACSA
jgi:hypothetical protein